MQRPILSKKPGGHTQVPFFSSFGITQLEHSSDLFPKQVKHDIWQSEGGNEINIKVFIYFLTIIWKEIFNSGLP